MIAFWYRAAWVLLKRIFQSSINTDDGFESNFRAGVFDCEGFRVMSAFKYANYVEYNRWEFAVRSPLFKEIYRNKYATATGCQKFIFRKPIKFWSKFKVRIETVGWDDKWLYNVQKFEQNSEIKAMCISRSLVWKKDKPQILSQILKNAGIEEPFRQPPAWVLEVFENDSKIIANQFFI
jgi:acyl-CoA thioesterase FadM